jgi:hypothetical protein
MLMRATFFVAFERVEITRKQEMKGKNPAYLSNEKY